MTKYECDLLKRITQCCPIHWKYGSDPEYRSVPRVNCAWCMKVERLVFEVADRAVASGRARPSARTQTRVPRAGKTKG